MIGNFPPGLGFIGGLLFFLHSYLTVVLFNYNLIQTTVDRLSGNSLKYQNQKFDFIIVGSGASGSVLASRLSESFRVLLLEAGGEPHAYMSIPKFNYALFNQQIIDWRYKTTPQTKASLGLKGNSTLWPAGKGLGGSSILNGMIYIRGNVEGFDALANEADDDVYRLENVLKYFKKLEDYNGYFMNSGDHGHGGGLSLERTPLSPFIKNLLRAGEELGFPMRDPNAYGPLTEGFAPTDFYLRNGRRWNAYDGFIEPAMRRNPQNLIVQKFAFVRKVLLDNNNVAYGVEYENHGATRFAYATKEVILSAGAIQSAKILMLSGIGPRAHLEELGVKVKLDLPVGQRLQDKYGALIGPFLLNRGMSFKAERDLSLGDFSVWNRDGSGIFSAPQSEATYSILSESGKARGFEHPDLHTYILASSVGPYSEFTLADAFNFRPDVMEGYFGAANGMDSFLQLVTLSKPFGWGEMKLRSKDPHAEPLLDPKYLHDDRDVKILVEGLRLATKVVEGTDNMRTVGGKLIDIPFPGCEAFEMRTDPYYECLARHTTLTAFKYSGTAPIGRNESVPYAVVDPRLRVLKTRGLRVVDASVLEERLLSINQVSCQMLGLLAADFIAMEYNVTLS